MTTAGKFAIVCCCKSCEASRQDWHNR